MSPIPSIKLSNGVEMPILGLGTWQSTDDAVRQAVEFALTKGGYPLIDTAACYGNENVIGEVLADLIKKGAIKREDVFITTKLWTDNLNPKKTVQGAKDCLARLGLEKVDLLLAHMCISTNDKFEHEHDVTVEDVWRGLEEVYNLGLARAIGVSNWNEEQIERVMKIAKVPIHNVQNELHIYLQQRHLQEVCKKHNISLTSYGSLGSPGRVNFALPGGQKLNWAPAPDALQHPYVLELAKKYNKSPAQALIRYCIDRGIAVIPKSVNEARLKENIDVFDFHLTADELKHFSDEIKLENENRLFLQDFMIGHPEDPFKNERK